MPNLLNGSDSWLEQLSVVATSECPEHLARANWKAVFIWSNCKFCDLNGRKWLNQLTLDCGKVRQVRRAKWPIPASLLQQKSCQNLRCWLFQLHQRGSFSCLRDTALAYYITVYQSIAGKLSSSTMLAKREGCGLRHCLSLQVFATDLSGCTPLNPILNPFSSQSNKPVSFEQPATRLTLPMPMSLCGKEPRKTSAQICGTDLHS